MVLPDVCDVFFTVYSPPFAKTKKNIEKRKKVTFRIAFPELTSNYFNLTKEN